MTDEIHGFCEDRFAPLKDAFIGNFEAGRELGASLAVTWQGRMVVDLWGGWADPQRTMPWRKDTVVHVASTTKTPLIISALMLVDRGLIDLDAPVARYWPEFGQGGKQAVTVRDAFTHQAGVPGLPRPARRRRQLGGDGAPPRRRNPLVRRRASRDVPHHHLRLSAG